MTQSTQISQPKSFQITANKNVLLSENDIYSQTSEKSRRRRHTLIWFNIVTAIIMHTIGLYGLFLVFTKAHHLTTLQLIVLHLVGILGVTAGLHRLWTHRTYKAKWPLRLIWMISCTISFQGTIHQWCRDHRVHHKYSDTDADPHNINNGFFFAHIGWLMSKKYPEVIKKGSQLDMQDILNDPIAEFQRKYIRKLVTLLAVFLPTAIPMLFWGESLDCAFCVNMLRYLITLHTTLCVNSFAHYFGKKPYDKDIKPVENKVVSFFTIGEAFHNYHHTFPWDYKTAELGGSTLNFTALMIELFAKIGWAYDLKTTSENMIKNRCLKTGDGTHEIWGWGDKDQPSEDFRNAIVTYRKF